MRSRHICLFSMLDHNPRKGKRDVKMMNITDIDYSSYVMSDWMRGIFFAGLGILMFITIVAVYVCTLPLPNQLSQRA